MLETKRKRLKSSRVKGWFQYREMCMADVGVLFLGLSVCNAKRVLVTKKYLLLICN